MDNGLSIQPVVARKSLFLLVKRALQTVLATFVNAKLALPEMLVLLLFSSSCFPFILFLFLS
jgi:hypothetical protein